MLFVTRYFRPTHCAATFLRILCCVACFSTAFAQPVDNLRHRFGVAANLSLNFHAPDFKKLPNVYNCCPQFKEGSGSGLYVGILYDLPLSKRFSVGARLNYMQQDASLVASESVDAWDQVLNLPTVAGIEHRITTSLSTLGADALLNYNPGGTFRFHLGMRVAALSSIGYEQREEMMSEGYVFAENRQRTRNEFSGTVQDVVALQSAVLLGASIEIALNKARTVMLAPELFYHIGSSNFSPNLIWKADALRLGAALKFSTSSMLPDTLPPLPPMKEAPIITQEKKNTPHDSTTQTPLPNNEATPEIAGGLSLRVVAVNDENKEMPFTLIRAEECIGTQLKPLLAYVFFDSGADTLPARYRKLGSVQEANAFSTASIAQSGEIEMYHHLLNIVGSRMKEYPNATLTLTGCNSDAGIEKGNTALSRKRAENVKRYLVRMFGIAEKRIIINARNLPLRPSRSSDENVYAADEENRRVELHSSLPELLAPLRTHDTLTLITPRLLRFLPDDENMPTTSWELEITGSGKQFFSKRHRGVLPKTIEWSPSAISRSDTLSAILYATTRNGLSPTSLPLSLPVQHITLRGKQQQHLNDNTVEQYRLILFDFDQSQLSAANKRIIDLVRGAVQANSDVLIEGFSDELGDDRYNISLSEDRARTTAKVLGVASPRIRALGESDYFNNSFPEGRFYNRTVLITITTPR